MKNFLQNGMYGMLGSAPMFGDSISVPKKKKKRPKQLSPLSDARESIILKS